MGQKETQIIELGGGRVGGLRSSVFQTGFLGDIGVLQEHNRDKWRKLSWVRREMCAVTHTHASHAGSHTSQPL